MRRYFLTAEQKCPGCGASLNYNETVTGQERPKPGDASVCAACGELLRFTDDLTVAPISPAELAEMRREQPEDWDTLLELQRQFRTLAKLHASKRRPRCLH
jgi:hypothetical protein